MAGTGGDGGKWENCETVRRGNAEAGKSGEQRKNVMIGKPESPEKEKFLCFDFEMILDL